MLHGEMTDRIIKAFYRVYNTLGYGFLEKNYENALCIELRKAGFQVVQQHPVQVFYEEQQIGDYFADIVLDDLIILELKAAEQLRQEHVAQLTNYLKATKKEVGLLLNFGSKPEFKRVVFTNNSLITNPRESAQSASSAFYEGSNS
jgi:GxxExxY protein